MSEYLKKPEDINHLTDIKGGCFASNKITVDGERVGYAYREEPSESFPEDSGWRFLAGSEDDEYTDNPENIGIFDLNTICNYDERIIQYLEKPVGTVLIDIDGELTAQ